MGNLKIEVRGYIRRKMAAGDVGEFENRSERLYKEKDGSLILLVLFTQLEDGQTQPSSLAFGPD